MNNPDFTTVAAEIAREAGSLLEHYYDQRVAVEYKAEFDLVTAADRASEKLVVAQLQARFPTHSIVAEEGGGVEHNSGYVWYVDPLDGTTNPMRKECFTAERGSGAYVNNRRLHVSKIARFQEGLYATGFASANRRHDVNVHFFHRMSLMTHGVRRPGSAALDLCYVAAGRLEGFWEFGLKSWDVAAGLLMVSEAGGKWGDMRGGPYKVGGPHLAATNGLVHEDLLKVFGDVADGRLETPLPPVKL
jgi:myo-inositol-1(or 4)-monophosphatase